MKFDKLVFSDPFLKAWLTENLRLKIFTLNNQKLINELNHRSHFLSQKIWKDSIRTPPASKDKPHGFDPSSPSHCLTIIPGALFFLSIERLKISRSELCNFSPQARSRIFIFLPPVSDLYQRWRIFQLQMESVYSRIASPRQSDLLLLLLFLSLPSGFGSFLPGGVFTDEDWFFVNTGLEIMKRKIISCVNFFCSVISKEVIIFTTKMKKKKKKTPTQEITIIFKKPTRAIN